MKIVLLGAQGSGKGTQAKLISQHYDIPQISTGDMLRMYASQDTDFGRKIKATIDAGNLVADDIIFTMLKDRICQPDCKNGFILDGIPRTLIQAQTLETVLSIDVAILIDVDVDKLVHRLSGRLTCKKCGNISHVDWTNSRKCEKCGGDYIIRADDADEQAIKTRLDTFAQKTKPVIDYYASQKKLKRVDGMKEVADVFNEIQKALGQNEHKY